MLSGFSFKADVLEKKNNLKTSRMRLKFLESLIEKIEEN